MHDLQIRVNWTRIVLLNTEWNHDLGGFMKPDDGDTAGPPCKGCWYHNPERYARWLQAGVFQGIFRTHMSAPGDPTPWRYPNFEVLREAFQLRNALGPYIYTAAFQAYQTGVLPCHPLCACPGSQLLHLLPRFVLCVLTAMMCEAPD